MSARRELPPMFTRRSILPVVMVFLLGVFAARGSAILSAIRGGHDWSAAIHEVRDSLLKDHISAPDSPDLSRAAITGMLDSLNDDYAQFVTPSEHDVFEKELTGAYVGIGAQVNMQDGWLTIVSPMEDSPALRAGILPDDRVVAIDGASTRGKDIDDCVDLLLGEPGTDVTLTVERLSEIAPQLPPDESPSPTTPALAEPATDPDPAALRPGARTIDIPVTRGPILARTIRGIDYLDDSDQWDFWLDRPAGIAYIRLSQFTPTCAAELALALDSIGAQAGRVQALVLDLRDNPGGTFEQAVQIADMFLDAGRIVSTRDRRGREYTTDATPNAPSEPHGAAPSMTNLPLAILVNDASASASEIVAGALADNHRAVVIGTRTFGKGVVQTVRPVRAVDGAMIKFTHQRYVLPSGRTIHREDDSHTWGVDPTDGFYVALTSEQERNRFLKRRQHEAIRARAGNPAYSASPESLPDERWDDADWIESSADDPQLAAALRASRVRLAEGKWVGSADQPSPAQAAARDERLALAAFRGQLQRELARVDRRLTAITDGEAAPTPEPESDLWPDAAPVAGGTLEVFDRTGKRLARLRVAADDLEAWLIDAGLTPEPAPDLPRQSENHPAKPPQ